VALTIAGGSASGGTRADAAGAGALAVRGVRPVTRVATTITTTIAPAAAG
jgi:hypothetical protein